MLRWKPSPVGRKPAKYRIYGSDEKGFAAYMETRFHEDTIALGLQSRLAVDPGVTKLMTGALGKVYVEQLRTLLLGEVDVVNKIFTDIGDPVRTQLVGAAGFTVFPLPGVMATLLGERNQIDVAVPDAQTAATLLVNWFPYAHFEAQLMGRLQFPSGGEVAKTLFFQIHYFL